MKISTSSKTVGVIVIFPVLWKNHIACKTQTQLRDSRSLFFGKADTIRIFITAFEARIYSAGVRHANLLQIFSGPGVEAECGAAMTNTYRALFYGKAQGFASGGHVFKATGTARFRIKKHYRPIQCKSLITTVDEEKLTQ